MFDKTSILILGGTGYIGTNCYKGLLERGLNVFRTGRNTTPFDARYLTLDITDTKEFQSILRSCSFDYIISSIGYIHLKPGNQYEMNDELVKGNIESMLCILDSIKSAGCNNARFINLSSMSVYGVPADLPVGENQVAAPQNSYGISKLIGERIAEYYAINYNIPVLNLRIPGVFGGERKSGAIYNFTKNALLDNDIQVNTKGLKLWSIIYIETLVDIVYKLICNYKWEDLFKSINVGYGENIDIIDVAHMIVKKLKSKSNILVQQPIDYSKFYMSTSELQKIIDSPYDYVRDIYNYIEIIKSGENQ